MALCFRFKVMKTVYVINSFDTLNTLKKFKKNQINK